MALANELSTKEHGKFVEDAGGKVTVQTTNNAEVQYSWANVATQVETNVKETAGYLKGIVINTPLASGTIAIYNNGSGASNSIGLITQPGTLLSDVTTRVDYDLAFSNGLTVTTGGANQDITIIYK